MQHILVVVKCLPLQYCSVRHYFTATQLPYTVFICNTAPIHSIHLQHTPIDSVYLQHSSGRLHVTSKELRQYFPVTQIGWKLLHCNTVQTVSDSNSVQRSSKKLYVTAHSVGRYYQTAIQLQKTVFHNNTYL